MVRLSVVFALLAACAGTTPVSTAPPAPEVIAAPGPLAGEPMRTRPGSRACTEGCLNAHVDSCAAGEQVWRVESDRFAALFGTIHVSTSGFTRLDLPERDLYGVDGTIWQSCVSGCGGLRGACVPYPFRIHVGSLKWADDCTFTNAPAQPWHGYASETLHAVCKTTSLDLRLVPALEPVRDALIASGMWDQGAPTNAFHGLVVGVRLPTDEYDLFTDIAEEDCDALALPEGYERHASLEEYEEVETVWRTVSRDGDIDAILRRFDQTLCDHYVAR